MRRTGRRDVTAMPFGIDTPTLFALVFGGLGPVMLATGDAVLAWKTGMAVTVAIGLARTALAFAGDWTRRAVPQAALLGSIGAVAIRLVAFVIDARFLLAGAVFAGVSAASLCGPIHSPSRTAGSSGPGPRRSR
jgi:AGZA family xanthine/uracil permease-like MFS transporter